MTIIKAISLITLHWFLVGCASTSYTYFMAEDADISYPDSAIVFECIDPKDRDNRYDISMRVENRTSDTIMFGYSTYSGWGWIPTDSGVVMTREMRLTLIDTASNKVLYSGVIEKIKIGKETYGYSYPLRLNPNDVRIGYVLVPELGPGFKWSNVKVTLKASKYTRRVFRKMRRAG